MLLPFRCLVCGRRLWHGRLCSSCIPCPVHADQRCPACFTLGRRREICLLCRLIPSPFRSIRFLWNYDGEARRIISIMKYRPSIALCRLASFLLASADLDLPDDCSLVLPVPASRKSIRIRGFNQCAILAGAAADKMGLPVGTGTLQHLGSPHPQASLPHWKRLRNVRRSFAARPSETAGRRILLIDDVITTGATSTAAALSLLAAGADSVDLLALARSEHWGEFRQAIHRRIRV